MGKKSKTPQYATTTVNSGDLFGSSTSGKTGTTFKPENWQKQLGDTASAGWNTTLQNMLSNDYANDPNFQAYQNQLNKSMSQNYDTSVLSQLADRGLMRSSGLQAATNAFNDTLANQTTNLYNDYYNRQQNNLSSLINTENALFNYITGLNSNAAEQSRNVSNYNMARANANKGSMLSNTLNGAMSGAMTGSSMGPWGALGGAVIGGTAGAMNS